MQYANGMQSREQIFQAAKKLMHQNGYKKTTYSMIAAKADVPVGLVNYHFKKLELLERIYRDYFAEIDNLIEEQEVQPGNEMQHHILFSRIMLTQIFAETGARKFHLEINYNNLIPLSIHDFIRSRQIAIIESTDIKMTSQYYYWCATAEYGARRELIELNGNIAVDSPEFLSLCDLLSTITLRIAGLDPEQVDGNLRAANSLYECIDSTGVRMF